MRLPCGRSSPLGRDDGCYGAERGRVMSANATLRSASGMNVKSQLEATANTGEATIGEMAAEFGVSLRTLRFYEDRKLLRPRREGNSRIYGPGDRIRLQMILRGKQLGFTLTEIGELIGAQDVTDDFEQKLQPQQIVTQIDHLERQRREIDEAIVRLRATHARLAGVSDEQRLAS
jgi:DNA-binding transcriptional MerR regulator